MLAALKQLCVAHTSLGAFLGLLVSSAEWVLAGDMFLCAASR